MVKEKVGLVWEGGGAKGSFGVGFLTEFKKFLPSLSFNVLSGASVGGINILPVCINDYELLKESWEEIKRSKVLNLRVFPTIFDTKPLRDFFTYLIEQKRLFERVMESENTCLILSVSKEKGPIVFTNKDVRGKFRYFKIRKKKDLLIALLSTSSIPYFFPSIKFNGETLIDGGVYSPLPIEPLMDVGGVKKIIAIIHEPVYKWKVSLSYFLFHPFNGLIENYTRDLVKKEFEKLNRKDRYIFKIEEREIFLVYPIEELSPVLDFSKKAIDKNFEIGKKTFKKTYEFVVKFLKGGEL